MLHKPRFLRLTTMLLITVSATSLMAQKIVSGNVTTASDAAPLPGVSIVVQGASQGVTTDFDGNFVIEVNEGNVLVFTYVGMKPFYYTVGSDSIANIAMEEDTALLDEVVVVGYGTQRKSSLTGAVSKIGSEKLTQAPVTNSTNLLAGRSAGVITRQTSSVPGGDGASISIRGFDNPLVMVDGIPAQLGRIDPNDIESITVLKDAAAAIYGVRAGEGVVLITTKRGKEGKTSISLHTNTSFNNPTRFQSRLGAVDYLEFGKATGGLDANDADIFLEKYRTGQSNTPDTDWYRAVFTNWTPLIQHNINVTGGTEKIKYFASGGFQDQRSQYRSGDLNFKRYNGRLNLDAQLTNSISTNFSMNYILEDLAQPGIDPSTMFNMLQVARPIYLAELPDPEKAAYSGFLQRSPLAATKRKFSGFNDRQTSTFTGQWQLKYDLGNIVEGLSTRVRFDFLRRQNHIRDLNKPYDVWEYDPNPGTNTFDTFPYILQGTQNARSSFTDTRRIFTRMVSTFGLNYQRNFENHNLGGLFLIESTRTDNNNTAIRGYDLISYSIPFLTSADPSTIELVPNTSSTLNNGANESALLSYVTRFNYAFKNRYFVETTLRIDQSSLFDLGNRTGFFPSVSAGWTISNESFMNNFSKLNLLKLRMSYSQVGSNIGIDPFQYLSTFAIGNSVYLIDDGTTVIGTTGLANSDVTWFQNNTYNLGFEGRFWNSLFGFELDLFYRLTKGRFAKPTADYPTTFGNTAILPFLNLNDSDNRGVEVLLTHKNTIGKDFNYHVNGNFTFTQSKWVNFQEDIPQDPEEAAIVQRQGKRRNRFFGYQSDGLFESQEEIDNHAIQDENKNVTIFPGDIKYVDQNGDGIIDFKDNVEIGRGAAPDISYGLDIGFTYKNFSFSALFQGAALFNTYFTGSAAAPFSNESIPLEYHKQYSWMPDADNRELNTNPDAQLPYVSGTGLNQNSLKTSDFWLRNNDYLRLKTLNVNYSLPKNVVERIGAKNMDIYLSGTNLFTLDRLGIYGDHFDPETRSGTTQGATSSSVNAQSSRSYPITKTITVGLRVSL